MHLEIAILVAFHLRPQIASDLGRNVTRSTQIATNSRPQIQIAAGLNPLRFENRNPPLFTGDLNSSNRKPAGYRFFFSGNSAKTHSPAIFVVILLPLLLLIPRKLILSPLLNVVLQRAETTY